MNRSKILHWLLCLFSILWQHTYMQAQSFEENDFALYRVQDGLTHNHITGLAQDDHGYLWIATQKGLNRYDGNSFLQFYSDSSRTSLPNEHLRELRWIKDGRVGMRTAAGFHLVNAKTLQQRNIILPAGALNSFHIENNIQGWNTDDGGNLFLLTSVGFYHFNKKDELVFHYEHYKEEDKGKLDKPFGRGDGIILAQPGTLLIATTAGTFIYHIAHKDFHAVGQKDEALFQQIDPAKKWVHFMHCDEKSFSVVREQATELAWYDLAKNKKYLIKTTLTGLNNLFGWRSKITRVNDSTFTITGNNKGFYLMRYNKVKDEYRILPELYLPNYLCRTIFSDKQNRLWIGTDRGLLRQKQFSGNLEKRVLPHDDNPLDRPVNVSSMAVAGDKLFVGTFGAGIYVFDKSSLRFLKRIDFSNTGNTANHVYQLLALSKDNVYAATYGSLISIQTNNYQYQSVSLPDFNKDVDWISWMHLALDGTLYISTSKNNVFYYRQAGESDFKKADFSKESLFNILTPMHISEDIEGNIWFSGHGICRFNIAEEKFDLLLDSFPKIKNERKETGQIAFDKNGKMYFGVEENGLMIYNPADKKFEHITRSNGLPDNIIDAVYLHKNKLWLGTESGLANYDIHSKKIFSFGLNDNMPEGGVTAYSFFYDSVADELYAGFHNAVVRFNPDQLSKNNLPSYFFIESIQIAGSFVLYHPSERLSLSYKNNNLVVNLSAVNFEDAHQQLFAYRLIKEGGEEWTEIGKQRNIIFSNLAPGAYKLQVKVYVQNNSWQPQIREINILIEPPLWRRTWFMIICALLIISTIGIIFRTRIKNIRRNAQINTQIAELEMKGLHAQMNPHFVFNALNSIKEMVLVDEKKQASRYLSKFAQLVRTNLEQSQQTFVTLEQSVDHLKQYLEMEKIRFRDFLYSIEIGESVETEAIKIPPMLLQPLVENAIWHGLRSLKEEKRIVIRFLKDEEYLVCEIDDNGIGINKSLKARENYQHTHSSMGIANIRERLELLNEKYGISCSLIIKDKSELSGGSESGTIATLMFKLASVWKI